MVAVGGRETAVVAVISAARVLAARPPVRLLLSICPLCALGWHGLMRTTVALLKEMRGWMDVQRH